MSGTADVLLISMPFAPLVTPSLGLSLLKAAMDEIRVSSRVLYCSIRFAELIGERLYTKICHETHPHDLLGEWIFADSLSGYQSDHNRYVADILRGEMKLSATATSYLPPASEELIEGALAARARADRFLEECLDTVIGYRPRIVGFTSVFLQQVASLSLARLIKAALPDACVVFGGANCEGVMGKEIIRRFHFVDFVVSGEADIVFPEMVRRLLEGRPVSGIQGVLSREKTSLPVLNGPVKNTPVIEDMDSIPIPDYDDYFQQLAGSSLDLKERVHLLFETSRGCWWGEKHHCTFCGLNGETMAHRSKSAERALSELAHLTNRYPGLPVRVVDNILDMDYFKSFVPRLAEQNRGLKLFYEVKSNLKKDQVRQLRDAGITLIQPGIESLSDTVLKMMRKGVRALQNIQLLKWCEELGIVPEWNLLWGFPGEPEKEYSRMANLVPLLTHLQPPVAAVTIRVDRFSPNFNRSQELGFKNLSPYPAYHYIYNLPAEAINNLAYYFTFEYIAPQDVASYVKPLALQVAEWQKCYEESLLFYIAKGDRLLIWDTRPVASEPLLALTGLSRLIYELCDQIRTPGQLLDMCRKLSHQSFDLQTITATLKELAARKIMIEENGSYLALAVRGATREVL